MKSDSSGEWSANLRTAYAAIVDYHNGLAYIRFTIAGLHLAASGFLISSWYEPRDSPQAPCAIPVMGFLITIVCIALEMRTAQLLANLDERGLRIEKDLKLSAERGFFALMYCQPIRIKLPFPRKPSPDADCSKPPEPDSFPLSHTNALYALYFLILVFWLYVLGSAFFPYVLARLAWILVFLK